MIKPTISIRLFETLLSGKEQLSQDALQHIVSFVKSQRLDDGSFMNKSGKSDLYYTVFGWMLSLAMEVGFDQQKAESYLKTLNIEELDLIHYAAYIRCRMMVELKKEGKLKFFIKSMVPSSVKSLCSFEGVPHQDIQSPYSQFIWLSLLEDTGNTGKFENNAMSALENYRTAHGGYKNTRDGLTATTNATAAALSVKGQLEGYNRNEDLHFILDTQSESGGFPAAEASPMPDLLSTSTALFVLSCYGVQPKFSTHDFLEAHWLDSGGFSATLLENRSDVEYTFYGLLALGALSKLN